MPATDQDTYSLVEYRARLPCTQKKIIKEPNDKITGINPRARFGIIPSATRDCSTYQFPYTELWKLEFHE